MSLKSYFSQIKKRKMYVNKNLLHKFKDANTKKKLKICDKNIRQF